MKVFELYPLRGHSVLLTGHRKDNGRKERPMSLSKRYANKQAKASTRRRPSAPERLQRDRRQAQRAAEARHQALEALGLPETRVTEIAGRLRRHHQRLGTMVGMRFPALCGCRTPSALCRGRGWDTHGPARLRGALPKRSWLKRLRRLSQEVLEPIWRPVAHTSPATQSRWQWTWVWDDAVFHTYGAQVRGVGRGWSGQHQRVVAGLDGLVLRGVGRRAGTNCRGRGGCSMRAWPRVVGAAWSCQRRWEWPTVGGATRSACSLCVTPLRAPCWSRAKRPMAFPWPRGARSKATT